MRSFRWTVTTWKKTHLCTRYINLRTLAEVCMHVSMNETLADVQKTFAWLNAFFWAWANSVMIDPLKSKFTSFWCEQQISSPEWFLRSFISLHPHAMGGKERCKIFRESPLDSPVLILLLPFIPLVWNITHTHTHTSWVNVCCVWLLTPYDFWLLNFK